MHFMKIYKNAMPGLRMEECLKMSAATDGKHSGACGCCLFMKKLLLTCLIAFACATGAMAQRTEVTVGYGGYTQMDVSDCHD